MPWSRAISAAVRGGDFAPVVLSVGQQDDDLALGVALAQAVDCRRQSVADGRAVLHHAAAQASQQGLQRSPIGRQRALGEGFAREGHQSDAVAGAVGDEVAGDLLGCLDAVGLEVLGQHRGRNIDRQHDVDAFGVARRAFIDRLGAGQRYDEERDGRAARSAKGRCRR